MSLSQSVCRGGIWNFVEQFLRRGIVATTTIVLSYFLAPADFGLLSMLSLFIALAAGLMDSGLREALIRRRRLSERLLNTATWAALGMGGLAYLMLFLGAPWVAAFYHQPQLEVLIRVAGLAIIPNALQTAPAARLANSLDFKAFVRANFPASVVSCTMAVILAYAGAGVWALIAQSLLAACLASGLVWREAGWPLRRSLDVKPLLSLYRFGYKLFLSSLISITVKNSAPILIGKFLGATLAGYYYFIDKIMEMAMGQLVYSVQNVTYPAFSKLYADGRQLKEGYRKVVTLTVFVVSPCLAITAGVAEPLFALVFAAKWQPAMPYFRWMCIIYMMYPLHAINLNILKVKGRSDIFLKLEIIKAFLLIGLIAGSVRYGLTALLVGQLIGSLLCYLPNSYYSRKMIAYPIHEQIGDVFPYFLVAGFAGGVAALLARELAGYPDILRLFLAGTGASATFMLLAACLRLHAIQLLREIFASVLRRKNEKK